MLAASMVAFVAWAHLVDVALFCSTKSGTNVERALAVAIVGGVAGSIGIALAHKRPPVLAAAFLAGAATLGVAIALVAIDSATYRSTCYEGREESAHFGYLYVFWGVPLVVLLLGAGWALSSAKHGVTAQPKEQPDEFFKRLLAYEFTGQSGRALVPRKKYQQRATDFYPAGIEVTGFKTVEIYDDPIDVPGVPQKTSKAVTYTLTLTQGSATEEQTFTSHAVQVGDRWAWIFGAEDAKAYKAGTSPSS
jgi:hypothetical protein